MTQLQNTMPPPAQPLPPVLGQLQAQYGMLWTSSIALSEWDDYGFTIPASRIRSWVKEARQNGIMREGAVTRFGQRYYATPLLIYGWMGKHGERTPLSRSTHRRRTPSPKAGETRATDGGQKSAQTPELKPLQEVPGQPTQGQPTPAKGQRHHLTDAQVRQSRLQLARAAPEGQEAVILRLAKRYGFKEQTVRDAAMGRTYKHLPMPQAQPAQPRKTKTAQAVETAAAV